MCVCVCVNINKPTYIKYIYKHIRTYKFTCIHQKSLKFRMGFYHICG